MSSDQSTVFLNGEFMPIDQASVSVLDRGFLLGDGVYEVIPVYGGHLFRLEQHLERLQDSLDGVRINNPYDISRWREILQELVAKNNHGDQSVYLQITRGVAPVRDHAFPDNTTPTVFLMSNPIIPVDEELLKNGIAAITTEDIRWQYCNIKAITLLANVMSRQQALDEGAKEAILVRDDEAIEGAASNLFIVKDGVLITPPKSHKLLPGITRDLILELAHANKILYRENSISTQDLRDADEVWLSSSTKEILPVTTLNGAPVGTGNPGKLWTQMIAIYQKYKESLRKGTA